MKKLFIKMFQAAIVVFACVLCTSVYAGPDVFNAYFINAARVAKPSVVNIHIYDEKPLKGGRPITYGSGTIITSSGYIITNYHVIIKGAYCTIVFNDGATYELQQFANNKHYLADPKTDIALLKINNHDNRRLVPVGFDDSNKLADGEWVMAIGNPYGLKQTITSGIVSSKGRQNIGFADIEDFIQTDVPINPGNSGGPLINLHGKMVGLNTAIRTESGGFQGISFAIPSNIVKQVFFELKKYGRVRRGWLGFLAKESDGLVQVLSVIKGSPAESAGIKIGDYIREIDRVPIRSLGGLVANIGKKEVGSRMNITISRDGKLMRMSLTLREKREYKKIKFGLKMLFMNYGIEIDEDVKSNTVVISYISARTKLAYKVNEGDIIEAVNERKVESTADFIQIFADHGHKIHHLRIYRNNRIIDLKLSN